MDEVTFRLCVAVPETAVQACARERQTYGLRGIDSLRAYDDEPFPDGAIHFVELGTRVHGVFRDNVHWEPDRFLVWRLDTSPEAFLRKLNDFLDALGHTTVDSDLKSIGQQFFDSLVKAEVRGQVMDFLRPHMEAEPTLHDKLPSIFVRMVQQGPDPPPIIPLGFLAVSLSGETRFLGYHFRIETPLEVQSHRPWNACVARWLAALPPESSQGALRDARSEMGERIASWSSQYEASSPFGEMGSLRDWIDDAEKVEPLALVVLSHHDRGRLYFRPGDFLFASAVQREFDEPSVAILNGCGTIGPGATDIIRALNRRGVSAVLATSTEVRGDTAGSFLDLLAEEIETHRLETDFTLSQAYSDTVRRLRDAERPRPPSGVGTREKYGANALRFTLLGNGHVRLCPPGV